MTTIYVTFVNDHYCLFANEQDAINYTLDELLNYLNQIFILSPIETNIFLNNAERSLKCGRPLKISAGLDDDGFYAAIQTAPLVE